MYKNHFAEAPPTDQTEDFEDLVNEVDEKSPPKIEGKKSSFNPTESSTESFEPSGFEVDDIFSFAETEFLGLSEDKKQDEDGVFSESTKKVKKNVKSVMSEDAIEISAAMYVEILESVVEAACEWFSGMPGDYRFQKVLKEKYTKISQMYLASQNISLTPSHFFALMTVLIVGASGFKAFKQRGKRITAEKFQKKSADFNNKKEAGMQGELFSRATSSVDQGRTNFECEFSDGIPFFTKGIDNAYSKKANREEVPPEISSFIFDYKTRVGTWPKREHVKTFLNN